MSLQKAAPHVLNLDWEKLSAKLQEDDPNAGNFYVIVINKGQENEYRTRFMSHKETADFLSLALEKKRLRISTTL